MPKFFPKFLVVGIVLSLLLGAGYGLTTLQARSIPWDCADWQAFAHSDRTTSILESLAENRGKTLYCGVDQSDTFTKAETWEAGKDRNERDDTVYYGERGQFRGFIAAQEGWLTDGESGVTGVSIDRIFEFPREERRRTKRVKRLDIANDPEQFPITDVASCGQVGGIICTGWGQHSGQHGSENTSLLRARKRIMGVNDDQDVNWETQQRFLRSDGGATRTPAGYASPNADQWLEMAAAAALRVCRSRGGQSVTNVALGKGHNSYVNSARNTGAWVGADLGLFYLREPYPTNNPNPAYYRHRARQSRTWSATCKKVIRRTRK